MSAKTIALFYLCKIVLLNKMVKLEMSLKQSITSFSNDIKSGEAKNIDNRVIIAPVKKRDILGSK